MVMRISASRDKKKRRNSWSLKKGVSGYKMKRVAWSRHERMQRDSIVLGRGGASESRDSCLKLTNELAWEKKNVTSETDVGGRGKQGELLPKPRRHCTDCVLK